MLEGPPPMAQYGEKANGSINGLPASSPARTCSSDILEQHDPAEPFDAEPPPSDRRESRGKGYIRLRLKYAKGPTGATAFF